MPYLYAKAIEAHIEGTPVMRSMVFELTGDPAVNYLDTQYMLGEALLYPPIFREDGVSEYYLPQGKWTHLLSGEVGEGWSLAEGYIRLFLYAALCKRKHTASG